MAMPTTITGTRVESMPTEIPLIITVAGPVKADSAICLVGLKPDESIIFGNYANDYPGQKPKDD